MVEIICSNYLLYTLMGIFALGVLSRVILIIMYNSLKHGTYGMTNTAGRLLKQMKFKYESYGKLEIPVSNVEAFVKRAMYEYRMLGFMSFRFVEKLLGQALFWCLVIGTGVVAGGYFLEINQDILLLHGAAALLFVILLYNIDKVSDIAYLRENVTVCIVDYFENHLRERLPEEKVESNVVVLENTQERDVKTAAVGERAENVKEQRQQQQQQQLHAKKESVDENKIIEDVLNEIFC